MAAFKVPESTQYTFILEIVVEEVAVYLHQTTQLAYTGAKGVPTVQPTGSLPQATDEKLMVSETLVAVAPTLSLTMTVKVEVVALPGVPEITPVLAL